MWAGSWRKKKRHKTCCKNKIIPKIRYRHDESDVRTTLHKVSCCDKEEREEMADGIGTDGPIGSDDRGGIATRKGPFEKFAPLPPTIGIPIYFVSDLASIRILEFLSAAMRQCNGSCGGIRIAG